MATVLKNIKAMSSTISGYVLLLGKLLFSLRMIVSFLLVFMTLDSLSSVLYIHESLKIYLYEFGINIILGWVLFSLSRYILLHEHISKMEGKQIFSTDRINALFSCMIFFSLLQTLVFHMNISFWEIFKLGNLNQQDLFIMLIILYGSVNLSVLSFFTITLASKTSSAAFFSVALNPKYLIKIFVIWLLTSVPIWGLYYSIKFVTTLNADFDRFHQITDHAGFLASLAYGFARIIAFILFASAFITTTKTFLVKEPVLESLEPDDNQNDQDKISDIPAPLPSKDNTKTDPNPS